MICLGNPKLNGGSIIEIDKAKTTLTRVCEVTLTDRDQVVIRTYPPRRTTN